jgi:hypothetical protein
MVVLVLAAGVTRVQAQADDATKAAARQLGEQGIQAFWTNDFVNADEKLNKAYRLYAAPTLGLWSARARAKRDHWVEAAERYREATRAPSDMGDNAAQKQAQADAENELNELLPKLPSITIQIKGVEPSEVSVTLDGAVVPTALIETPRPTNPGRHRLIAVLGSQRYESELTLAASEQRTIAVEIKSDSVPVAAAVANPPAETPAPQPIAAPVAARNEPGSSVLAPIGIGVASLGAVCLIASGVTALIANGKLDACPGNECTKASEKNSYDTVKSMSTVTFYSGLALAAAGAVTWLLGQQPKQEPGPSLSFDFGPTGAAVRGRF